MSFWRTFGFQSVSPIDTILDRDHFTLEDLLDEDDILTECKGQNKKLLDFLINPETLMRLLNYIIDSPEQEEEKERFKYPYLACEILCLDIWDISEAIFASGELLTTLWGYFLQPPPLDSLVCSYITRICGVLLQRQVRETFTFLQKQPDLIPGFAAHLGNPTVTELLLKIVACDETNDGSGILDWLLSCHIIPLMLSKLSPDQPSVLHENICQALESIIEQTPINRPSPFIDALLGEESLTTLINCIRSNEKSVFLSALSILSKLLERFTRDETTLEDNPIDSLPLIVQKSVGALDDLVGRLRLADVSISQEPTTSITPNRVLALPSAYNRVILPIGPERLKILEFFSTVIRLRYSQIDSLLIEKQVFEIAFELFVAYPWNNFLHTDVRNLVSDVFSGINLNCKIAILQKVGLLDILIRLATENQKDCEPKGISSGKGYMGFVTQMSNGIQHACSSDPALSNFLTEHPEWKAYAEGLLESTNTIEKTDFGEPRAHAELRSDSSSEDSPDYSGPNQELVSVFKQYLSTHQFNGTYPAVFPDHEEDEDEYDDDDTAAPAVSTEQLVLDRTFEQDATPYSTNISGYYDAPGDDTSSEDEEDDRNDAEFDPHEDSDDAAEPSPQD